MAVATRQNSQVPGRENVPQQPRGCTSPVTGAREHAQAFFAAQEKRERHLSQPWWVAGS